MSREHARHEVRKAIEAVGTIGAFAKRAEIDPGTLGDFLSGKRWASGTTRTKIEQHLGWPAGRIADLEQGLHVTHVSSDPLTRIVSGAGELPEADQEAIADMVDRLRLARRGTAT